MICISSVSTFAQIGSDAILYSDVAMLIERIERDTLWWNSNILKLTT